MSDDRDDSTPTTRAGSDLEDLSQRPEIQALLRRANHVARIRQEIEAAPAREADELGYMARAFIACTIPHKEPQPDQLNKHGAYIRRNGPYTLTLISSRGFPYGKIPRVLIGYIQTEVVRTRERQIRLGRTLTECVERLQLYDGGSTLRAVSTQLHRSVGTVFEVVFDDGRDHDERRFVLTSRFCYRHAQPRQLELWDPVVTVSEDLYLELVDESRGGVPYDWRIVRALRSPLAIDLYWWTTHTTQRIRRLLTVPIEELHRAFGGSYPNSQRGRTNFQQRLVRAAADVRAFWPEIPLSFGRGRVLVAPGRPHVRPRRLRLLPTR